MVVLLESLSWSLLHLIAQTDVSSKLSCFQVGCYCGDPSIVLFHHYFLSFCFVRLVLFVIATCTLTNRDLFWGASEKNSVAEECVAYTTGGGKLKEKRRGSCSWWILFSLCDKHQNIYADSFCLRLWFWFSYKYLETQRAKLCPPILLWKGLCDEIILAMLD